MKKYVKTSALAGIVILLSACASGYRVAVPPQFKDSKTDVHLGSFVAQKEIDARMPIANTGSAVGMQFGLIGALIGSAIDSSINKSNLNTKEAQLAPLRDALVDFNYNPLVHENATKAANQIDLFNITKTTYVDDYTKIDLADGEHFLKFDTSYSLTQKFDGLEVFTNVTLYKITKTNKKKQKEEVIFKNRYKYLSPLYPLIEKTEEDKAELVAEAETWYQEELNKANEISDKRKRLATKEKLKRSYNKRIDEANGPHTSSSRNLAMSKFWGQNDAELMRKHLNEAVTEITSMVLLDLPDIRPTEEYKKDKSIPLYAKGLQKVKETEDRVIIRDVSSGWAGQMCSIVKGMVGKRCIVAY